MRVGVGCSDNPDATIAGVQAASAALSGGEADGAPHPCDLILLFSTASHDPRVLREAVRSVAGEAVPIVGGGGVGIITSEMYGYAGDQTALAAFWFDGVSYRVVSEEGLDGCEFGTGVRLGAAMAAAGTRPDTPAMLFYDAIDRSDGGLRLNMATPLLAGLEQGLGFLPHSLVGAGLQGDYICTPTSQWIGDRVTEHSAFAMLFSEDLRIDSVILHGCRPATGYYTVTKAEGQMILEINGEPALPFMQHLLGPGLPPEEYAFFLIFGINSGDEWSEFNEEKYANRLCLAVDRDRNGIIMFEPDMTEGTRFQVMHRSLGPEYITPRTESLFSGLGGRKPVFAFYIDCAGRAAGYAGLEFEDAEIIQAAVSGRVPLLGIYSGVEIAPVSGKPRALDWTGVFCLLSVTP